LSVAQIFAQDVRVSKHGPEALRFKLKKHKNRSGKFSWRVHGYWPDGKRERSNFKHRGEALEYMGKIEKEAGGAALDYELKRTSLTRAQLADAECAVQVMVHPAQLNL